ncbi:hypothetical protein EVAR_3403_1 [Eumeta japonica]|uniref:Uncharacterized protein n=1 Tax=Eumeta variegata TaxID=151549 RepID=A0A4C1SS54_EUMVA|nr:hypothetical protein EVAR_3403_1 [Eumeta japonica]
MCRSPRDVMGLTSPSTDKDACNTVLCTEGCERTCAAPLRQGESGESFYLTSQGNKAIRTIFIRHTSPPLPSPSMTPAAQSRAVIYLCRRRYRAYAFHVPTEPDTCAPSYQSGPRFLPRQRWNSPGGLAHRWRLKEESGLALTGTSIEIRNRTDIGINRGTGITNRACTSFGSETTIRGARCALPEHLSKLGVRESIVGSVYGEYLPVVWPASFIIYAIAGYDIEVPDDLEVHNVVSNDTPKYTARRRARNHALAR